MIYRLEVENFYSVRERQVLDLTIGRNVPDPDGHFAPLHPGSEARVPKVVVLFGPNAAGKSNVLRALAFLAWFIRDSFQQAPDQWLPYDHFAEEDSRQRQTRLSLHLTGPGHLRPDHAEQAGPFRYEYEIRLKRREDSVPEVVFEGLRRWPVAGGRGQRVFERFPDGRVLESSAFALGPLKPAVAAVRSNASLVATLAQFNHGPSVFLRDAARLVMTNILMDKVEMSAVSAVAFMAKNPPVLDALNREIQRADLGIDRVEIDQTGGGPEARFFHGGLSWSLPLFRESHGTQTFIGLFPYLHHASLAGGVAVVDELDQAIHPLLLPEIIGWFRDRARNPQDGQLWMTCQNAALLEDLHKEEVFFCEKASGGRTTVYGAKDVQGVRRSDNLYRLYRDGRFGAVPHIG